jgi:hypothetical protein
VVALRRPPIAKRIGPPNSTVGAVPAAKQRNNALWTATRYELSFQKGDLILSC